jgi:predicted signal transduction protein with EAL and GGDEF domain
MRAFQLAHAAHLLVQANSVTRMMRVTASIGLAERLSGETIKALIERADAEMYRDKAASRTKIACAWKNAVAGGVALQAQLSRLKREAACAFGRRPTFAILGTSQLQCRY